MKKSRFNGGGKSAIKDIAFGTLIIWGAFLVLSLLFSLILFFGDDPTANTALFSLIAFMCAAAIAALINKRLFQSSSLNAPLLSAIFSAVLYLIISGIVSGKISIGHCQNETAALQLKKMIIEKFKSVTVEIHKFRGLCSFYAEKGGVLVGFEKA